MSNRGYGAVREYRDDPDSIYSDDPPPPRRGAGGFDPTASFTSATDDISATILQIRNNVAAIEKQVNDVGTSRDSASLRQRIHDAEQKTNKLISTCTQQFKKLARQKSPNRQSTLQIERLKSDFEDTIQRYNRLQKLVASKVKSAPPLQSQVTNQLITLDNEDDSSHLIANEQRRAQLQAQSDVIETEVALIEEREEQIRQLEGDIININEIFRDLAAIVYEQGDLVDSIEANVEKGYDNVEGGAHQLEQASRYASKYRKKLCIFGVIIGIIAAIITIILVVELRKK